MPIAKIIGRVNAGVCDMFSGILCGLHTKKDIIVENKKQYSVTVKGLLLFRIAIFVRILYAAYDIPDKKPIAIPRGLNLSPPIIPDTRPQPITMAATDIVLSGVSFSPKNNTEYIITSMGAVYIRTTAVETEVICIEEK